VATTQASLLSYPLGIRKKGENLPFPQAELSEKLYAVWSPGAKKLQPL